MQSKAAIVSCLAKHTVIVIKRQKVVKMWIITSCATWLNCSLQEPEEISPMKCYFLGLEILSGFILSGIFWSLQEGMCQRPMTLSGEITFLRSIPVPCYTQKTITGLCPEADGMKQPFSNILIRSVISESCLGWGWKHQNIVFPPEPCPAMIYFLSLPFWLVLILAAWKPTAALFRY